MRTAVLSADTAHPTCVKLCEALSSVLNSPESFLSSFDQAEKSLARSQPQIAILLLSPNPDWALKFLGKVRAKVGCPILAVGPTSDPKLILHALNEGADHYLDEENPTAQFDSILARLNKKDPGRNPGHVISLLSASGGCGTSTLAVNLAVVLAGELRSCALLDLEPGSGDLSALLDLKPTHTLADLCLNTARIDQAMLEKALLEHSSGVYLLAPPQRYEEIRLLNAQGLHKTLHLVREKFPAVVIDHEDCFHDEQVMALHKADKVLVVARLDFTSVRNAHRVLDHLDQIGILRDRIEVVINRYGQPKELPVHEVEEALKIKITHLIPEDARTVNNANNTGVPLVLKAPSSKVAQSISQLGKCLIPQQTVSTSQPPPTPRSGLRWLAGFR